MMVRLSMMALLAAAGQTALCQALDQVEPQTKEVTSTVYADGRGGISLDNGAPGLLRSGDVIVSIVLEPAPGAAVCQQRSHAQKKTGTKSCGFLGLQRCAVISKRVQQCDVLLKECDHFVWTLGRTQRTCTSDISGVVVGAPMRALPALREGLCSEPCDKGGGWEVTGKAEAYGYPPTNTRLGTVRYTVKRFD